MAAPPPICGFVPVEWPKVDKRWLEVKDAPGDGTIIQRSSGQSLAQAVDAFVNHRIQYQSDTGDDWADPLTTLERGYGDCEDFCLLKRRILIDSGVPASWTYLIILDDLVARQRHAMLLVYDDRWRMLDNRSDASLPVELVKDYSPILALSGNHAWTFGRKL